MKKIFSLIFILSTATVFSQEDGSETYNVIRDAIKASIPEGFIVNTGQTTDNRFNYSYTYDENGSELNRLIYNLIPGTEGFSEIELALGEEPYLWNERKALFIDGSKTGMSGIEIILKNNAGKFSVMHRDFKTYKPMNKEDLEQLFSKFSMDKLESTH